MQVRALDGLDVVSEGVVVRAFDKGAYVTYAADRSLRFRFFQVHSDGDRGGYPPPPGPLAAIFFD